MYWKIESTDAFDIAAAPAVNVGSLADNIEHVRAISVGSRDELTISPWHDLDHLIGVLSRLSLAVRD